MTNTATFLGLFIALFGPILIAAASETISASAPVASNLLGLMALLAIVVAIVLIVLEYERQPLSSFGLHPLHWRSVAWGLALAGFFMYVFAPVVYRVLQRLELGGFEGGIDKLARLPIWCLVLAVIVGGASEEILYRGYAVERISSLSGSYWIGGLVPLLFFGVAHVPMWGWGPALTTFVSGAMLTIFYIWQQDLLANVVAHVITDFAGIVMPPLLARMRLF